MPVIAWPFAGADVLHEHARRRCAPSKEPGRDVVVFHRLIFRWRWAEDHFQAQTGSNSWRYVDPADATAAWPMRKAQLEREITVEPVTASMLRDLLDEAYEDGRADEHAGCERGERRD